MMKNLFNNQVKNKIKSKAGESISETLVALLISALALVMLAGVIAASSRMITNARNKLDNYYEANNYVAKLGAGYSNENPTPSGSKKTPNNVSKETKTLSIIRIGTTNNTVQTFSGITVYSNYVFSQNRVKSYKKQ